jgi:hypothetical protein
VKKLFARTKEVKAQVSMTGIIDAFYNDFATEASGRYWWWCQMVLLDPNEIIVNDGEDQLYRIPFTIDGDSVTFGEAQPVKIEYVDIAARAEQAVAACAGIASVRGEKVAASYDSRADTCPDRKEGGTMKEQIAKLRAKLNLPADTPDEEVIRVAAEADPGSEGVPEPETEGTPQPEGQPGEGDEEPDAGTEGGNSGNTAGDAVQVDSEALRALQADAKAGREAREEQIRVKDEALLSAAVESGKFAPARKAHFAALLKADREGTTKLIEALEENVVPVALRGSSNESNSEGQTQAGVGYPKSWLPELHQEPVAASAAAPRVVVGGD